MRDNVTSMNVTGRPGSQGIDQILGRISVQDRRGYRPDAGGMTKAQGTRRELRPRGGEWPGSSLYVLP